MELTISALYQQALLLNQDTASTSLRGERIRGAKRYWDVTLRETSAFLHEFEMLSQADAFSPKELSQMLGNTCLETASLLFSAGAASEVWRAWCALAGQLFYVGQDLEYAMELLTIARSPLPNEIADALRAMNFSSYRAQAIRFVVFQPSERLFPSLQPNDILDTYFATIVNALISMAPATEDMEAVNAAINQAVNQIVESWLDETSYGKFELGIFPVFEPEIKAVVAALKLQGLTVQSSSKRVSNFLRAGLE